MELEMLRGMIIYRNESTKDEGDDVGPPREGCLSFEHNDEAYGRREYYINRINYVYRTSIELTCNEREYEEDDIPPPRCFFVLLHRLQWERAS